MAQCEYCRCGAKFFVNQPTVPQRLADGTMETSPAGRSNLVCGNHLFAAITTLGNLPFRTDQPVSVTLQRDS
jgi:hypothetical protein